MAKTKKAATKTKSEKPAHYTASGTKKHQANGPVEWSKVFKAAAKIVGSAREGEGVRLAMAYAVANEKAFLKWAEQEQAAEEKAAAKEEKKAEAK